MSENPIKNSFQIQYEMLLNAIPSSVLMVDRKLQILSVNENFLIKSQRSKDTTVGRPLADVFPLVILQSTNIEESIRNVFHSGIAVKGQKMTYRAPGVPLRIYYYSILPIQSDQIILIMEDVTEQFRLSEEVRRVERHLASVVESASDIVLSTDIDGRILTWNSAAEKLSGLPTQDVYGRYFFDFCDANQKQMVEQIFQRMKTSNAAHTTEFNLLTPSNSGTILISWVFSPMKDDYSKTVGTVVVGRDLAERRKLELQLRQSQKLTALGVMAGGIAHEIRNPLAICSSAAQFLQENQISDDFQKECAKKIQTNIQKASAIIENLLRFARSSLDTEMIEVDLISVLKETIDLVTNQAKVQKIKIHLSLQRNSIVVSGVPGLLQQVFMNIFLNAINAMPTGGVLSVTVNTVEDRVIVRVIDTGVGIPAGELDKIFDPFHTSSPVGQGTGLGLSICYSIIRQHLGSIQAESRLGQGAAIIVTLPLL
ncbi:MAG: PAS domain-containing sensor histidine kinase [Methylococcales bacterium]|nr:MAG: PAS domain-containing sensor histidine kinase [Methylococcales bacterium]